MFGNSWDFDFWVFFERIATSRSSPVRSSPGLFHELIWIDWSTTKHGTISWAWWFVSVFLVSIGASTLDWLAEWILWVCTLLTFVKASKTRFVPIEPVVPFFGHFLTRRGLEKSTSGRGCARRVSKIWSERARQLLRADLRKPHPGPAERNCELHHVTLKYGGFPKIKVYP